MKNWTCTRGTEGAAVTALSTAPNGSGFRAVCATTGGLLVSADTGSRWDRASGPFGSLPLLSAALSPSHESDHLVFLGASDGICYSRNMQDWTLSRLPLPTTQVTVVAPSPTFEDDGVVLAATMEDGILRSGDRGVTFEAWNFGLLDLDVTGLALSPGFAEDATALAATATGVFRTTNGGRAWRETSLDDTEHPILSVAFSPRPGARLALASDEAGNLYRSEDMGRTWRRLSTPLEGRCLNAVLLVPDEEMGILVGHESGVALSPDGGATWEEWEAPSSVSCLAAPRPGSGQAILLAGLMEGGIYRSEWP